MTTNNFEQLEIKETSKKKKYFSIIESLLFAAGEPLSIKELAVILEVSTKDVEELSDGLQKQYESEDRGIKIIKYENTLQLVTKAENGEYLQKLLHTNARQSLSQASLETLAIIVYRQPITRVEIDEIRGVKSDSAITTLLEKNLIVDKGRKDVLGRPILYGTTNEFFKYFDFNSLEELPNLDSFMEGVQETFEVV